MAQDPNAPADKPAGGAAEKVVDTMLSDEGQQKLAPLKAVMDEFGWPLGAEKAMVVAQKDPRTAGKTPEELATMMRDDPSIYDDLEAMDSGALDKAKDDLFGGKMPEPKKEEPEPDAPADGMGDFLKDSATMKDADPKKATKAAKGKDPKKMDFGQKAAFMSEMSGE